MLHKKLHQLENYAKEEKWEEVDELIPKICKTKDVKIFYWALGKLLSNNGNVRDLGCSILEKYPTKRLSQDDFMRVRQQLAKIMKKDKNPYARFRASFALMNHGGPGKYREILIKTLEEAEKDPNVSQLTKHYLSKLS